MALRWLTGLLILLVLAAAPTHPAEANSKYASIVLDAHSGEVLRARNADKRLHPASLTKMMTLYMMFEALDDGKLAPTSRLYVSRRAESMPASKLGLRRGETITVEDAIYALATKSANDVAVVVAEALAGSEWQFARDMTDKARLLGMGRTTFHNASGLHHERQVSTARDMAVLARALIFNHRDKYHVFGTERWRYKGQTYRNTNRLLGDYPGMDGLKTGYIRAAGFNLAASAVRDGRRLVGVVFGGRSGASRNRHMVSILDEGFASARQMNLARLAITPTPAPARKPGWYERGIEVANAPPPPDRKPGSMAASANGFRLAPVAMAAAPSMQGGTADRSVERLARDSWSVQVGAYSRRDDTSRAIASAVAAAPQLLSRAQAQVVPLSTRRGVIYRARLVGLDRRTANAACAVLPDCLAIAPRP